MISNISQRKFSRLKSKVRTEYIAHENVYIDPYKIPGGSYWLFNEVLLRTIGEKWLKNGI